MKTLFAWTLTATGGFVMALNLATLYPNPDYKAALAFAITLIGLLTHRNP